jgi:hypothetical protein
MKAKSCLPILEMTVIFLASQITAQEIRAVTTTKTNLETQSVYTIDSYIRCGKTNLVSRTKFKEGSIQIRLQRIYRDGKLLGEVVNDEVNGVFGVSTEPNSPYSLDFQFARDKTLRSVSVGTNRVLVDAFTCTNGILFPVESSNLEKANELGADLADLFAQRNVQGKSPEEFNQQVDRFIRKHKNK